MPNKQQCDCIACIGSADPVHKNNKGIDYSKDNVYDALGRPDLKEDPPKTIPQDIYEEFEQNYLCEWRWNREQASKPSAGDFIRTHFIPKSELKEKYVEKDIAEQWYEKAWKYDQLSK